MLESTPDKTFGSTGSQHGGLLECGHLSSAMVTAFQSLHTVPSPPRPGPVECTLPRSLLPAHTPRPQVIFKKMGRRRRQATEPHQDGDGSQHPLRSVDSGVPTRSCQWQCDSGQGLLALVGPWLTLSPLEDGKITVRRAEVETKQVSAMPCE